MFADRLRLELTLTVGSEAFVLPGGCVKRFRVDADNTGFDAELFFVISAEQVKDELQPEFVKADAVRVKLSMQPVDSMADPAPFKLTGYVTAKSMVEVVGEGVKGEPVLLRHYKLRFSDPARALWTQHYPSELHVNTSLKAVIELQKAEGVSIQYEWAALNKERPMIFLGLGRDEARASFYDFVMWLVQTEHGCFEYDYETGKYRFGANKAKDSSPTTLLEQDLDEWWLHFPESRRHNVHMLNPHSEKSKNQKIAISTAVTGVRRDIIAHTPIADTFDAAKALQTRRSKPREHELSVTYCRYPREDMMPNRFLKLEDEFSKALMASGRTYRVVEFKVAGKASGSSEGLGDDLEEDDSEYEIEASARMELRNNPTPNVRPFTAPTYPSYVEGKVVSPGGDDKERTWFVREDDKNSLLFHEVQVPLWNKKIVVPFEPGAFPGHFFYPAYKHQRVHLAMHFDGARVSSYVDWAANARVPQTGQGNRAALAKQDINGIEVTHDYASNKPQLEIRRTQGNDLQTFVMKEGTIRIEVKEDKKAKKVEPKFDVTMRVEAAKGKLDTKVKGSVTQLAGKFEGSTGKVTTALTQATADLDASLVKMESTLTSRAASVRAEVEALIGTLKESMERVVAAVSEAKAEIVALLAGLFVELLAKLAELEAAIVALLAEARTQVANVRGDVETIDDVITDPLDRLQASVLEVRSSFTGQVGSVRSELERLQPSEGSATGIWEPFETLLADIKALEAELKSTVGRVTGRIKALPGALIGEWEVLLADVETLIVHGDGKLGSIQADIDTRTALMEASLQAKAAANPSLAAQVESMQGQLATLKDTVTGRVDTVRSSAMTPVDQAKSQITAKRDAVQPRVDALAERIESNSEQLTTRLTSLREQVEGKYTTVKDGVRDKLESIKTNLDSAEERVLGVVDLIPPRIQSTKESLEEAAATAKQPVLTALDSADSGVTSVQDNVQPRITSARETLSEKQQQFATQVTEANASIDAVMEDGVGQVQSQVETFEGMVDSALGTLDSALSLVGEFRNEVMPPLEELNGKLAEIKELFDTGVDTLQTLLATAISTLDAIPAKGLPKPLVDGALKAIKSAVDAVAPQIENGAKQAGEALAKIADQISKQVETVKKQALGQLDAFTDRIAQQIDAVLPQVKQQLQTVKTQIDNIVDQLVTQIGTLKDNVVSSIQAAEQSVNESVGATIDQATTQIDTARETFATQIESVRNQVETAKQNVKTQVDNAIDQVDAQIAAADAQATKVVDETKAKIAQAEEQAAANIKQATDPLSTQLEQAKTKVAELGDTFEAQLDQLESQNATAVQSARDGLPTTDSLDAQIDPVQAQINTQLESMQTQIDAL